MAAAYSASKAAVIGMTKSFGKDLAETGVLVNCIAPAVIATPMLEQMSQEHIDYMVSKIPMGRLGQPEEVAELDRLPGLRADDVLDRRDVRHLRRARGLLVERLVEVALAVLHRGRRARPGRAAVKCSVCPCSSKAALSRYCSYMRKTRGSSGSRWAM